VDKVKREIATGWDQVRIRPKKFCTNPQFRTRHNGIWLTQIHLEMAIKSVCTSQYISVLDQMTQHWMKSTTSIFTKNSRLLILRCWFPS